MRRVPVHAMRHRCHLPECAAAQSNTHLRHSHPIVYALCPAESLTPADSVAMLKDGVRRSISGQKKAVPSQATMLSDASKGQWPYAAVLSCIDSRAPVEQIFDANIGDLFVGRVAGNVASPDLIASLEYATKYAGAKAILVMGHTKCGAVKGAWSGLQDGHLTDLLARIQPAVDTCLMTSACRMSAERVAPCACMRHSGAASFRTSARCTGVNKL